jgi:O-methyltransferase
LAFTSKLFGSTLRSYLSKRDLAIVSVYENFNDAERRKVKGLIDQIKKETTMTMSNTEGQVLYNAVKASSKVAGDIAEVGVYKGGSARLICEKKGNRKLHLFDTFKGVPTPGGHSGPGEKPEGLYDSTLEDIKKYLAGFPDVNYYEGFFPGTAGPVENIRFSMINLDVDWYESTRDCLNFFYPRMNPGGVIISHDYNYENLPGVKKAFDEFFKDRPEVIIEPPGTQCMIIKA